MRNSEIISKSFSRIWVALLISSFTHDRPRHYTRTKHTPSNLCSPSTKPLNANNSGNLSKCPRLAINGTFLSLAASQIIFQERKATKKKQWIKSAAGIDYLHTYTKSEWKPQLFFCCCLKLFAPFDSEADNALLTATKERLLPIVYIHMTTYVCVSHCVYIFVVNY